VRAFILSLFSMVLCSPAFGRTWTDIQNRKIEAELVKVDGDSVMLRLADGRELPYPLAKLSPEDRQVAEESQRQVVGKSDENESSALNFDAPWPDSIRFSEDPEIKTVEEDAENKSFIYESAHYRYICDVRLARSVVKGFAVMFEATYLYCRTLPLAINGGKQVDGKFQILLFETKESYIAAGGPASSAGVFIGGKSAVLVPLESLGVKPVGSSYMLDRDKSSNTIPHELTHQVSPRCYFVDGAMGWFSEGLAEFVAVTPYRSGNFNVRGNQRPIMEYVTSYGAKDMGGRALGKEIKMPPLKTFMMQDYASFQEQPQLGYGCGLLLVTYFLQMDGDGGGERIKAYLKALHDGKEGEEALAVLLGGRTFEQLEQEITKAWGRKGVDFSFPEK
jgi:hypothetical protein